MVKSKACSSFAQEASVLRPTFNTCGNSTAVYCHSVIRLHSQGKSIFKSLKSFQERTIYSDITETKTTESPKLYIPSHIDTD